MMIWEALRFMLVTFGALVHETCHFVWHQDTKWRPFDLKSCFYTGRLCFSDSGIHWDLPRMDNCFPIDVHVYQSVSIRMNYVGKEQIWFGDVSQHHEWKITKVITCQGISVSTSDSMEVAYQVTLRLYFGCVFWSEVRKEGMKKKVEIPQSTKPVPQKKGVIRGLTYFPSPIHRIKLINLSWYLAYVTPAILSLRVGFDVCLLYSIESWSCAVASRWIAVCDSTSSLLLKWESGIKQLTPFVVCPMPFSSCRRSRVDDSSRSSSSEEQQSSKTRETKTKKPAWRIHSSKK